MHDEVCRRVALLTLAAGPAALAACAGPPKPKEELTIRSMVMTRIKEWPPGSAVGAFSESVLLTPVTQRGAPPPHPALLGKAIGEAIQASRERTAIAITRALAPARLDPQAVLSELLPAALKERGLSVEASADWSLAHAVHKEDYKNLPRDWDAILDVQIYGAGFYWNSKPTRLSPFLSVAARIVSTATRSIYEDFAYEVGDTPNPTDSRYLLAPTALGAQTLDELNTKAPAIGAEMRQMLVRIATALAADVAGVVQRPARARPAS